MLNFTNTSQILSMSQELIQNIVQMKFGTTQNEQEKLAFTSLLWNTIMIHSTNG